MAAPQKTVDKRITPEFLAQAGKGRPKGVVNKTTKAIREMVVEALENKGGAAYLEQQADKNPAAFLALVGKVLPLQLTGDGGGPIETCDVTADREAVGRFIANLADRAEQGLTLQ